MDLNDYECVYVSEVPAVLKVCAGDCYCTRLCKYLLQIKFLENSDDALIQDVKSLLEQNTDMGLDTENIEEMISDYDVADPSQRSFIFNKIQWETIEFLNNMIIKDAFFDDSSLLLRLDSDFQPGPEANIKELAKQYCE